MSVRRFNEYMGAHSYWVVPEGLHCDVQFVSSKAEVRQLDLKARILFLGTSDIPSQPSALPVNLLWRFFPRDLYDARAELTSSNARRRIGCVFGPRDYALR